jgi:predicted transposase/invertase (TIGR01784 family)
MIFSRFRRGAELKRLARKAAAEGRPLDLTIDVVFKSLLSGDNEDSREALRSLVEACICRPVTGVKILNPELLPEYPSRKRAVLDILCTFNDGEKAGIEMQVGRTGDDLKLRASIYANMLAATQVRRGKRYRDTERSYQIFFLDFVLFPKSAKVPRRYFFMEETEHDILNNLSSIIFFEMPKLEAFIRACLEGKEQLGGLSPGEKWCIYLKYKKNEAMSGIIEELCRKEEGIMHAERALTRINRSEKQWARALSREMSEMDYNSRMAHAEETGMERGIEKGIEKGMEAGLEKGMEVGLEKGMEKEKVVIAGKLKAMGFGVEHICEATGLSPEQVDNL